MPSEKSMQRARRALGGWVGVDKPPLADAIATALDAAVAEEREACAVEVDARPHDPCDFPAWHHPADDDDRAAHRRWESSMYPAAADEASARRQPRRYTLSDLHECGWLAWHAGAQYAMTRWRKWAAEQIRSRSKEDA